MGLSSEQTDELLQFQELTGVEDITICRDVMQRHSWNLELAVQETLNRKEGRPSSYAMEMRPPHVMSDYVLQMRYYDPPVGEPPSWFQNLLQSIMNFFWKLVTKSLLTFVEVGRRVLGRDISGSK